MGKALLYSIFAALFLWAGAKLSLYSYDLYKQGKASESWIEVEAQVTNFEIKSSSNRFGSAKNGRGGGSTTHVELAYKYHYNGVDYEGHRTGFGPYASGKVTRPSRKGKAAIYINPERPSQSVYVKGVSKNNLGGLAFALGLVFAGLYLAFLTFRAIMKDVF